MELVYLWVEDYKNIHKQGFNFSPRFRCEYDKDNNELTIEENEDYIPDFFGENINITAIVGKNGSGKSSILEYLSNNSDLLIVFNNNKLQINKEIKVKNNTNYKYVYKKIYLNCIYVASPDYLYRNLEEVQSPKKAIKSNILNKIIKDNGEQLSYTAYFDIVERQLNMIFLAKQFSFFNYTSNINLLYLPFLKEDINHKLFSIESLLESTLSDIVYIRAFELIYQDDTIWIEYIDNNQNIQSPKDFFLNSKDLIKGTKNLKYFNEIKIFCELFNKYDKIKYNSGTYKSVPDDIIYSIPFYEFDYKSINNLTREFFNLEWEQKFSAGENTILDFFSTVFYELKQNKKITHIFIDEGESLFHPNWQKKYISYLIQFIRENFSYRNIHIILTSHSPFLLSDIPKQNIIFLDKDEKGNCKVVDGLKEKKQTFGANIHTLLSDSFFMEDGLMGEFAKNKINEIIDFHKLVKKNRHTDCLTKIYLHSKQKKFWNIQNIIGEEYLKQVIKNHLVEIEKKLLGKDRAKQEEIKRVEAYLESLKK